MNTYFSVHPGQYAFTKDGRTIHIDSVITDGRYKGRDINTEDLKEVEITLAEIVRTVDEICKNVVVE